MTDSKNLRPATKLVRGGLRRSQFRETSEALFLNSGFVYDDAAQAEAAFKGEVDVFIYSRYSNPTVSVFEERLALLEGAEACRATRSEAHTSELQSLMRISYAVFCLTTKKRT